MTHVGNAFCRWLADSEKLHAWKSRRSGHCSGENPVQLTYSASVDIAFRLNTDTYLFFGPSDVDL